MDTLPAPTVDDLQDMDLMDLVNPYDQNASTTNHKTHVVNPPANTHIWQEGMTAQEVVDIARANAWPVVTLCGYVFVPLQNPENYPPCEACFEVAQRLMKEDGE